MPPETKRRQGANSPWRNSAMTGSAARRRIRQAEWRARPAIRCDGCGRDLSLRTRHPFTTYWCSSTCQASHRTGDTT